MSFISEAFVQVRPDLRLFANELRTGLPREIAKVGVGFRTVPLRAQFEANTKAVLAASLQKIGPIPVQVTPILAPGSKAFLRAQILEQIGPISVTTNVAARAGAVAGTGSAGGSAGSIAGAASVPAQTTAQIEKAAVAAKRLADLEGAVGAAAAAAAAEVTELGVAGERLAAAETLASKVTKELATAERTANTERTASLTTLKAQIDETVALSAARKATLEGSALAGGLSSSGQGALTASKQLALAEKDHAEQLKRLEIVEKSENATLIEKQKLLVADSALRLENAEAASAQSIAIRNQEPALNAISKLQNQLALASDPTRSPRARLETAASGEVAAADALRRLSGATSLVSAENLILIRSLEEQILVQKAAAFGAIELAEAEKIQAAAAARSATTTSQATRGLAATSASFLGLRGAVLSSSGPFLAATVAVIGLAKVIGTASTLQQSLNVLQSVSGATAEQMGEIADTAKELGADLTLPATSAVDAAAAMTELSKAGLSVNDTLAASRGVLELSAAANLSVGDSAKIVATELNAFGLAGSEATRVADLLAGASIAAQGEISDFALAFQQVSAVAHQVELPIETTTALLTQFAKAGLRGSDAGTSLRTMLLRLVPSSKAAAEAQNDLGIQLNEALPIGQQITSLIDQYTTALAKLDPIARQRSLNQIFGQDAIRGASISLTQGSAALTEVEKNVTRAGLAGELSGARMKGLSGSVEGLKSEVETLAATLGATTLPLLTSTAKTLSSVARGADEAASAITSLADVTVKPIGSLIGGTDTLATVGIAAAVGLGIRKLISLRKAGAAEVAIAEQTSAKVSASANVLAAEESMAAWAAQKVAAIKGGQAFAEAEQAANLAAAEANVAAALASGRAWVAESIVASTAAERAGAAAAAATFKVRGLLAGNKALGLSIAAIAGGQLLGDRGGAAGTAGSVLSSAGTGALIGNSIVPGFGALGGAALGLFAAGLQQAQKESAANKARWDGLTFSEQFAVISKMTPDQSRQFLSVFGLKLKSNPATDAIARSDFLTQFDFSVGNLGASSPPPGDRRGGVTTFADPFANIFSSVKAKTETTKKGLDDIALDKKASAQLALAIAQATGTDAQVTKATKALLVVDKAQAAALEASLFDPKTQGFIRDAKLRAKILKELTALYGEIGSLNSGLESAIKEAAKFSIPANVQVAGIAAGATEGLADDLAVKQNIADLTLKALQNQLGKKKQNQEVIDDLKIKSAQASADVVTTSRQINDQNVANARAELQNAADAAGNIGTAENKLIAFLKAQTKAAGNTTSEQIAAEKALGDEIKKRKDALAAIAQSARALNDSILETKLAAAQATPGIEDDERIFRLQIAAANRDIIRQQKLAEAAKKGSKARIDALLQIQEDRRKIIAIQQSIKGLAGGSGGFSLQDLFKEAVNQFNTFASNVSSGPQTTGGARAALAGGILSQRPDVSKGLDPAIAAALKARGVTVSSTDMEKISKASKTNDLLAEILATLKDSSPKKNQPKSPMAQRSATAGYVSSIAARYSVPIGAQ